MPEFNSPTEARDARISASETADEYVESIQSDGESFLGRIVLRYIVPVALWTGAGAITVSQFAEKLPPDVREQVIVLGAFAGALVGTAMGLAFLFSND